MTFMQNSYRLRYYIDLIMILTGKELKIRYKNSIFGYLWSVAHPLALTLVFYVALKIVLKIQMEDYVIFLIGGLFPWQWFSNSINGSPLLFLANSSIIKKIKFPRQFLPLALVMHDMFHFIMSLPVIILFLLLYGRYPCLSWIYGIPLLIILQSLMIFGFSLAISSLNLFFRDLERLTSISTMLLFYFTPVIYHESMVPERYKILLYLNPMAPIVISWRNLFLTGTFDLNNICISSIYTFFIGFFGYMIYSKLSWRFAEVL